MIIADGECQLARQRRVRAETAEKLASGGRVVRTKFGVDDEICTGDHSCIRLSGCPSLTVKPNPDPLRTDPVATVIESCVGCGLCGEVAHAAVLCPSFYRAEVISNPGLWDRTHLPRPPRDDRLAWRLARGRGMSAPGHHTDRRAWRRRRRRAHRLDHDGRGRLGLPAQSTSIPGVAQRTGATTYYIEIFPVPARELNGKRPVLALTPGHRRHRCRGGK